MIELNPCTFCKYIEYGEKELVCPAHPDGVRYYMGYDTDRSDCGNGYKYIEQVDKLLIEAKKAQEMSSRNEKNLNP